MLGIDVLDVHRGLMSWRRLRVLVEHLPPESHTMTALRNQLSDEELAEQADKGEPEKGRWSQQDQLLAAVVDALRRVEYVLICANSEKRNHPKPPEPMRRPGAKARPVKQSLSDAQAERLFRIINGGAA
ncbi:hypothetical protein C9F11_38480 [Streptomyces sp. YIM 121038]|uniref:hypothetical protein n=1 Tax=Streptomyces sp. YIM 121038 TaxID=2136401 RepID=UPI001162F8D3|nr:hypothetical protein [Streptomyces sp. YIM 121038]QCX81279.1 hypothetical protein C9F11_38480 [Streptomyces sp. YIM 121038]